MDKADLERIARTALREIGQSHAGMTLSEDATQPGLWFLDVNGPSGPARLKIRCGAGTSPQYVREQIFQQMA